MGAPCHRNSIPRTVQSSPPSNVRAKHSTRTIKRPRLGRKEGAVARPGSDHSVLSGIEGRPSRLRTTAVSHSLSRASRQGEGKVAPTPTPTHLRGVWTPPTSRPHLDAPAHLSLARPDL